MIRNLTPTDMAVDFAIKIERFKILRMLEEKSKEEVLQILKQQLKE